MQALAHAADEPGASKIRLTAGEANAAARALYESLGGASRSKGPTVNYRFGLPSTQAGTSAGGGGTRNPVKRALLRSSTEWVPCSSSAFVSAGEEHGDDGQPQAKHDEAHRGQADPGGHDHQQGQGQARPGEPAREQGAGATG